MGAKPEELASQAREESGRELTPLLYTSGGFNRRGGSLGFQDVSGFVMKLCFFDKGSVECN